MQYRPGSVFLFEEKFNEVWSDFAAHCGGMGWSLRMIAKSVRRDFCECGARVAVK